MRSTAYHSDIETPYIPNMYKLLPEFPPRLSRAHTLKHLGYAVFAFLAVSAAMPSWAHQNNQPVYERVKPRTEYSEFAALAVGASQDGVFAQLEVLKLGRHWLAPFGVQGTLLTLVDYMGREETILSASQLGMYFPIFSTATDGFGPKLQRGFMNLMLRANLLNYEIKNGKGFPPFFDLSLEWRSQFGMVTYTMVNAGYRYQIKSFDHNAGGSDISGIFASVHVVVGIARILR